MSPPHPRVAGAVLESRVRGGVSSHIGCSAPLVPGASFGRYGALSLPMIRGGGQGMRVPCCVGRGGPDGAASRFHGGVFLVSARGGSGPWGVSHTPDEGAAEGTEDLVHKGCVCSLGPGLSAEGGLQLLAHRQRPDLVDQEDGAQVGCCGGLRRPLALGDRRGGQREEQESVDSLLTMGDAESTESEAQRRRTACAWTRSERALDGERERIHAGMVTQSMEGDGMDSLWRAMNVFERGQGKSAEAKEV